MWRGSLLPLGVGAAEGCDLLIFRLRLKWLGKDRSLVALDSSCTAPARSPARAISGPVFVSFVLFFAC
ncbi:hypothetical protein EMIT043CA1_220043 [Pseudomonas brassicacearum]